MTDWNLSNHIIGKVYELSQENMCAMIADVEMLQKTVKAWEDQDTHEAMDCHVKHERLGALEKENMELKMRIEGLEK